MAWVQDGQKWAPVPSVPCPVAVRYHEPWLPLPRHTGLSPGPGHTVLQQGCSPGPHSPDQPWAPQSQVPQGCAKCPVLGLPWWPPAAAPIWRCDRPIGSSLGSKTVFSMVLAAEKGLCLAVWFPAPTLVVSSQWSLQQGGCRSQSRESACLAQAAPQHSRLLAGCMDTFVLCRSCHVPCLRNVHSRARRPASVQSSWDRLF